MTAKVDQLTIVHGTESGTKTSESHTLSQRLALFIEQRDEAIDRLSGRRQVIDDKLRRWSDFDARYQQLMDELKFVETKVDAVDALGLEESECKRLIDVFAYGRKILNGIIRLSSF
jgi:hypothetical protein